MTPEETEVPGMPSAPFVKFDAIGKKVKGKVIGKRTAPAKNGFKEQEIVDLLTSDGEYSIGCTADLAYKFRDIEPGELVSVEFTAKKPMPGKPQPMKVFKVVKIKAAS